MSARVTAIVWSRCPVSSGELLLALALADQATDLGEYIAIDVPALAKKTRQTKETVVAQLRRMADDGLLEQMPESKAFRFVPAWLGGQVKDKPSEDPGKAVKKVAARATRLTSDWALPADYKAWALATFPAWTEGSVAQVAERFRDHWISASGQAASKMDWSGTWRNWCRKEPAVPQVTAVGTGAAGEWWLSAKLIDVKGEALGLARINGETWQQWRVRVYHAAGDGPWMKLLISSTGNQGFQGFTHMLAELKKKTGKVQ